VVFIPEKKRHEKQVELPFATDEHLVRESVAS